MAGSLAPLAAGLYPVMLTPFTPDGGSVDYPVLEALTRWYLDNGAAGLFPVAQSSEMYNLQPEERIACAKVVKAAAQGWHAARGGEGRAPVVCAAGTFEGSVEEKAAFARRMHEEGGADVVVVLVCMMAAQDEDDAAWKANTEQFMALTGDVPLGLYECPAPYHRLLTPATLRWLADSGRFRFHKDTSRRNDLITEKLAALEGHGGPFRWYNGNCTTLLHSLQLPLLLSALHISVRLPYMLRLLLSLPAVLGLPSLLLLLVLTREPRRHLNTSAATISTPNTAAAANQVAVLSLTLLGRKLSLVTPLSPCVAPLISIFSFSLHIVLKSMIVTQATLRFAHTI